MDAPAVSVITAGDIDDKSEVESTYHITNVTLGSNEEPLKKRFLTGYETYLDTT